MTLLRVSRVEKGDSTEKGSDIAVHGTQRISGSARLQPVQRRLTLYVVPPVNGVYSMAKPLMDLPHLSCQSEDQTFDTWLLGGSISNIFSQKWIIHCQDQGLLTLVLISQCSLNFLSFQRWYIFGVVLTRLALFCAKNQDIDHGNTSQDISALRQTKIMIIQLKWFKWNFIHTTSYIGLFLHIHWRYVASFIILMSILRLFVAPVALHPGARAFMNSVLLSLTFAIQILHSVSPPSATLLYHSVLVCSTCCTRNDFGHILKLADLYYNFRFLEKD